MSNTTTYYHADWDNKVHAKLENVSGLNDELISCVNKVGGDVYIPDLPSNVLRKFILMFTKPSTADKILDMNFGEFEKDSFMGVAYCNERDEFDLEKGKRIASLKADLKYHNKRVNDYSKILTALIDILNLFRERLEHHNKCAERIENRLIETYGWKHDGAENTVEVA